MRSCSLGSAGTAWQVGLQGTCDPPLAVLCWGGRGCSRSGFGHASVPMPTSMAQPALQQQGVGRSQAATQCCCFIKGAFPALGQPPNVSGRCWWPAAGLTGTPLLAAERQQAGRLPVPADVLTNLRQMAGTLTSASLAPTSRLPHAPITSIVDPEVAGRPDSLAELTSVISATGACVAQTGSDQGSAGGAPDLQTQRGQPDSAMTESAIEQQGGLQVAELCCAIVRVRQEYPRAHLRSHRPASWPVSCLAASGTMYGMKGGAPLPSGRQPLLAAACFVVPCRPPCSR